MVYIRWRPKVTIPINPAIYGSMHAVIQLFRPLRAFLLLLIAVAAAPPSDAQNSLQFRVWLSDKGTTDRALRPGDPDYATARALLSDRAIARRSRLLPDDSIVTTDDLPIWSTYREEILQSGVELLQESRWFNTLLVFGDSAAFSRISQFTFVDSVQLLGLFTPSGIAGRPHVKFVEEIGRPGTSPEIPIKVRDCIVESYGRADSQLVRIGADHAHRIGVDGSGVLIGILDAGFDWRGHSTLFGARVVAEYDFVNDDPFTFDEDGQTESRSHGTLVMSVIGGNSPDSLIGAAPGVTFALAKTEDVASETPVEEDNYVAGLEWLEALGVDITNTSLGYTKFDAPYFSHGEGDLDGRTAFASRGVNRAARLGVLSVVSAGNEYTSFRMVGVPAEADSSLSVAALDLEDRAAPFSSQGTGDPSRVKPDIAAPGVRIYGADASTPTGIRPVQGTSLAAPLVTGAAALLLSASPTLPSWEVRRILMQTAAETESADTAVGSGPVRIDNALRYVAEAAGIAGQPLLLDFDGGLSILQWISVSPTTAVDQVNLADPEVVRSLLVENRRTGKTVRITSEQPRTGLNRWFDSYGVTRLGFNWGDTLEVTTELTATVAFRSVVVVGEEGCTIGSTLCTPTNDPTTPLLSSRPNPAFEISMVDFLLRNSTDVTLELYAADGERVLVVLDRRPLDAGYHSHPVDLSTMPGGAYYYRLLVGHEVYSWPIVLY